jgi:hypothetical protein
MHLVGDLARHTAISSDPVRWASPPSHGACPRVNAKTGTRHPWLRRMIRSLLLGRRIPARSTLASLGRPCLDPRTLHVNAANWPDAHKDHPRRTCLNGEARACRELLFVFPVPARIVPHKTPRVNVLDSVADCVGEHLPRPSPCANLTHILRRRGAWSYPMRHSKTRW